MQRFWPLKGDYPLGSKLGRMLDNSNLLEGQAKEVFGSSIYMISMKKKKITQESKSIQEDQRESSRFLVLLDYFVNQSASTSGYDDPDLNQKRIGIVGLGSIGSKVATRLKAFGCQISYSSRNRKPYAVPYHYYMDIEEMHGVIVNVALGAIIDEEEMELFELDNVVFSPHCAFMTLEGLEELGKVVVGNIEAFFSNKPLLTPVL
ncbi:D-isomer specific 2-hydroxyacid dehydrogenase NAD-binding domain [Arabidopsis suecica]|uniref:D-isomer specific 2-hydroxyacid dehydrogenase NAD-binding domain n=1 Tax=Arabidopsis suecica TaxID=45249 RepID=A0A8T2DTE5_ARASU|nr:D-isomer specific 2-hydroxyacid dehydrogenase NAD-binding domain [Arabidopsis suecica]